MKHQTPTLTHGVPDSFLTNFGRHVTAILAGFDRLRFRATLRLLFVAEGMEANLNACHVLRFLGHGARSRFRGELASTLSYRPEGICLRHRINGNSLKVYDPPGSILRVETTIVHPEHFKVCRPLARDAEQSLRWQPLRRSVADLHRRAEVSRAANGRDLDALASVSERTPLSQEAAKVCRPVTVAGQRYRPLNPWGAADGPLLEQISQGQYAIQGFRNRDLRAALDPGRPTAEVARRQAAAVTRRLRLRRAHGLITKVSGTHRWLLTEGGRRIVTALLAARNADVEQLTQLAA